jgi:hypothetical protein
VGCDLIEILPGRALWQIESPAQCPEVTLFPVPDSRFDNANLSARGHRVHAAKRTR